MTVSVRPWFAVVLKQKRKPGLDQSYQDALIEPLDEMRRLCLEMSRRSASDRAGD